MLEKHYPLAALGLPEPHISIVVPAYNEADVLPEFDRRLSEVRRNLAGTSEVIYVNDGNRDQTLSVLSALHDRDPSVAIVDLCRNFGKEIAGAAVRETLFDRARLTTARIA